MNFTYDSLTSVGGRSVNEDSVKIAVRPSGEILVLLADGLGGHGMGDKASQLVVEKAAEFFLSSMEKDPDVLLANCFQYAQNALMEEQLRLRAESKMKSTLVALLVQENTVKYGFVGDSRLYWFRNAKFVQRSLDHSVPQMLVQQGEIKEKDIRHHEDRNRLIRVLGIEWNQPKYELSDSISVQPGDSFLLCSDGYWEWILENKMAKYLKKAATPGEWLKTMEAEIQKNGRKANMDNYTAAAVFFR